MLFKISPVFAMLVLAGCATPPEPPKVVIDPQITALHQAATGVERQLEVLHRIEYAKTEKKQTEHSVNGLESSFTIQWEGSAQELIKGIADKIGYQFMVEGQQPLAPVLVPINVRNATAESILITISERMMTSSNTKIADIKTDAIKKTITIAYKK